MSLRKAAILILLLPATFALSQTKTGKTEWPPSFEAFGGYSYLMSNSNYSDLPDISGFNFGFDFRILHSVSWVSEASFFSLTNCCGTGGRPSEKTFLFGPRYSFPVRESWKIRPFAGFLIGGSTYGNSNSLRDGYVYNNNYSFAYDVHGGLDYLLTPHFAIRGVGAFVHSTLANGTGDPSVPNGYGREQFDIDMVYRF